MCCSVSLVQRAQTQRRARKSKIFTHPPTKQKQNSETEQFLFETTVAQTAGDVARELAAINNLRHLVIRLKLEGADLAKHGPAKRLDAQGIDTYEEEQQQLAAGGGAAAEAAASSGGVERGPHYCMDPTGRRTGEGGGSLCMSASPHPMMHA